MGHPHSLTPEQVDRFLTDGYLVLQPEALDDSDHEHFHRRATDLYDLARATRSPTAHLDILGDNLRARIPELETLLADPVVHGAATSLFGADYLVHPHAFCHRSTDRDQPFHQDGNLPWNERGFYRAHQPEWAMLFYYPHAVDRTNGPTEIVPGSHYWTIDHERPDGTWHPGDRLDRTVDDDTLADEDLERRDEALHGSLDSGLCTPPPRSLFVELPAGSVVLAHYDLFHRGSRTAGATVPRFMYKFYLARVRPPGRPAQPVGSTRAPDPLRPIVAANHRWLAGLPPGPSATDADDEPDGALVERNSSLLAADTEDVRVAAAYELGRAAATGHGEALDALARGLHGPQEATRRAAGHGLRQAGADGLPVLLQALRHQDAAVRRPAVAALGTEVAATRPETTAALIDLLTTDEDDLVRSNAAYSLGHQCRAAAMDPAPVVDALIDRLAPGAEADNAFGAAFARSTIRQSAALALVQAVANHPLDEPRLARMAAGLDAETDRYVQGLLIEALARAPELPSPVGRALIDHLTRRRWNPSPAADDPRLDPATRLR